MRSIIYYKFTWLLRLHFIQLEIGVLFNETKQWPSGIKFNLKKRIVKSQMSNEHESLMCRLHSFSLWCAFKWHWNYSEFLRCCHLQTFWPTMARFANACISFVYVYLNLLHEVWFPLSKKSTHTTGCMPRISFSVRFKCVDFLSCSFCSKCYFSRFIPVRWICDKFLRW